MNVYQRLSLVSRSYINSSWDTFFNSKVKLPTSAKSGERGDDVRNAT